MANSLWVQDEMEAALERERREEVAGAIPNPHW
jgi:hypothetical protein